MLKSLPFALASIPVRAPADGSGTLGRSVVGPDQLVDGGVTSDKLADLPAGRVLGRRAGAADGPPQALEPADLQAFSAEVTRLATFASRHRAEEKSVSEQADALVLLGFAQPGDGGGAIWVRDPFGEAAPWRFQTADGAWWRLAASPASPEMLGARGDGVADDIDALEATRDYCVATETEMELRAGSRYGLTRPLRITSAHIDLSVRGPTRYSEGSPVERRCALRKIDGFVGEAALIVGEPGGPPARGIALSGFDIDGAGFDGDGFRAYSTGRLFVSGVASHRHPRGWGFVVDGGFFPTFTDCVSRNNGSSELSVGGGVLLTNDERENADGRWIRGHINFCGNVSLRMAPRAGNAAQSNWTFHALEINDSFDREPGFRLNAVADIQGAWGVVFDHVRFMNVFNSPVRTRDLVLVGDPAGDGVLEDVTFRDCDFQHNQNDGNQYCIRARGRLRNLRIINPRQKGNAGFCDLSEVVEGEVYEDAPSVAAAQWNDPDRRVRNMRDGYVGPRPGSDGARFDVASTKPGAPLALGVTRSAGDADAAIVEVGAGAQRDRVDLRDFVLRHAPRAAPPADPRTGDVAYSDGSGGGFDGASGAGLFVYKGAAAGWVLIA